MRTIEASRDPHIRMLRQPPNKQIDYYYSQLLGKDWQEQFKQVGGVGFATWALRVCFPSSLPRNCC
jgi:hypothetical protein